MEGSIKGKLYPQSRVELNPFLSRHYDLIMDVLTLGLYPRFIRGAVADMGINPSDRILDMGCGTGRNDELMLQYLGEEGRIVGLDISPLMKERFEKRFSGEGRVSFVRQPIDTPFSLKEKFDIVFISFVLHGFPQRVRRQIISNAKAHLKEGGRFIILDYGEFDIAKMPALDRFIFRIVECPYAFDYIKRRWKEILPEYGLYVQSEKLYFRKYLRLLQLRSKIT